MFRLDRLKLNDTLRTEFAIRWLKEHESDSKSVIGKPFLVGEFGKNSRDIGYTLEKRNKLFSPVHNFTYDCARGKGACAGALLWQLFADGMDSYADGYEVVFGRSPSTDAIVRDQSRRMSALDS